MNPLRGRRQWGRQAAVSTGSSLATLTALDVLRDGGNAFDAAITASAMMMVVLPAANGPAGDAAAVLHHGSTGTFTSLTALGRAPSHASVDTFRERGLSIIPETGILSASTPGVIDGWLRLNREHGSLPLERLLAPAIEHANAGITVGDQNRRWTSDNYDVLEQEGFQSLYHPFRDPATLGTLMRQPGLASLLTLVASLEPHALRETIADAVMDVSTQLDGLFEREDLLADVSRIAPTTTCNVGGRTVHTNPAPTQGLIFLQHLALAERLKTHKSASDSDRTHLLAEIINQSSGWRLSHLGDPRHVTVPDALAADVLDRLERAIDPHRRSPSVCKGAYDEGDTTHFVIADRDGNQVSWIQSLGLGFGSGVGVPELGLLLCDRLGRSATLRDHDANATAPGRTPVNTIFAWAVSDEHGPRWTGGTPGGDGQTQWNLQTVHALALEEIDTLDALVRPKWTYYPGPDKAEAEMGEQLWIDAETSHALAEELSARGHDVVWRPTVGGVTRVVETKNDVLLALDDGRQEGLTTAI
jgi:gamma-glutamyltranspeptidase/glutathione hydrolase